MCGGTYLPNDGERANSGEGQVHALSQVNPGSGGVRGVEKLQQPAWAWDGHTG